MTKFKVDDKVKILCDMENYGIFGIGQRAVVIETDRGPYAFPYKLKLENGKDILVTESEIELDDTKEFLMDFPENAALLSDSELLKLVRDQLPEPEEREYHLMSDIVTSAVTPEDAAIVFVQAIVDYFRETDSNFPFVVAVKDIETQESTYVEIVADPKHRWEFGAKVLDKS